MKNNQILSNQAGEEQDLLSKSSEKTEKRINQNKEQIRNNDKSKRKSFWLTQAQKIIIQNKLPKLFSLIPISQASSRLALGSKILLEQSVEFQNRKRGRPDGSSNKLIPISPLKEKKSARIKQKRDKMNKQLIDSSQKQSSEDASDINSNISLQKELDYSISASKWEGRSQNSKSSLHNIARKQKQKQSKSVQQKKQSLTPLKKAVINGIQKQKEERRTPLKRSNRKQQQKQCRVILTSDECKEKLQNQREEKQRQNEQLELKLIQSIKVISSLIPNEEIYNDQSEIPNNQKINQLENLDIKPQQQKLVEQQKAKLDEQIQSKLIQQNFKAERQILKKLKTHQNILPFLEPVDEQKDGAPNYYSIISDPIDLKTIQFKLSTSIYRQPSQFHTDIQRMWNNARQYNNDNPFMQRITNNLQKYYQRMIEPIKREPKRKSLIIKKSTKLSQ